MADTLTSNGVLMPQTPKKSGFALTEYTVNPSPSRESPKEKAYHTVPEAFILPNGFPDVRCSFFLFNQELTVSNQYLVPPSHLDLTCL